MRRFIRYLYEYEQEKKMRNVGFVKVEQDMDQCVIHVHGKGFWMEEDPKGLEVYLFWNRKEKCTGIHMGVTEPPAPGLNYRLCYTPEDTGEKENYDLVNGIILKDMNGHWYAAVWNDDVVNVCRMEKWEMAEEKTGQEMECRSDVLEKLSKSGDEKRTEAGTGEETGGEREKTAEETDVERERAAEEEIDARREKNVKEEADVEREKTVKEEADVEREKTVKEETDVEREKTVETETYVEKTKYRGKNRTVEETGAKKEKNRSEKTYEEEKNVGEMSGEKNTKNGSPDMYDIKNCTYKENNDAEKRYKVRKIQRKDMVCLPRCEWKHANNSFLVHGYYNYHHLILTVRGGQLKLGVPGVYHPQEARAAESFGFPEFLPVEETGLALMEEEKNDRETFGYWCRNVRGPESCADVQSKTRVEENTEVEMGGRY